MAQVRQEIIRVPGDKLRNFFNDPGNREKYVLLHPGNFSHKNKSLWENPAKSIVGNNVPTLNMPMDNIDSDPKVAMAAAKDAMADVWKTLGAGRSLVYRGERGKTPWDIMPNGPVKEMYIEEFETISEFCKKSEREKAAFINTSDAEYKAAYLQGKARIDPTAPKLPDPWFDNPTTGIAPPKGSMTPPTGVKDVGFDDPTWQKFIVLGAKIDKTTNTATYIKGDTNIHVNSRGIFSLENLTEESAEMMIKLALAKDKDGAILNFHCRHQADMVLLKKAHDKLIPDSSVNKEGKAFKINWINNEEEMQKAKAKKAGGQRAEAEAGPRPGVRT